MTRHPGISRSLVSLLFLVCASCDDSNEDDGAQVSEADTGASDTDGVGGDHGDDHGDDHADGNHDDAPESATGAAMDDDTGSGGDDADPPDDGDDGTTGDAGGETRGEDADDDGASSGDDGDGDGYYCPTVSVEREGSQLTIAATFTEGCSGPPVEHPSGERVAARVGGAVYMLAPRRNGDVTTFRAIVPTSGGQQLRLVLVRPDADEFLATVALPQALEVTSPLPGDEFSEGEPLPFTWTTGAGPTVEWSLSWHYVTAGGLVVHSPVSVRTLPDEAPGQGTVNPHLTSHDSDDDVDATLRVQRRVYGTVLFGGTFPPNASSVVRTVREVEVALTP